MDPEKRLLIIPEDLTVKLLILLFLDLGRALVPKRVDVIERLLDNLGFNLLEILRFLLFLFGIPYFDRAGRSLFLLFGVLFRLFPGFFLFLCRILQIDLDRHEGTVFLNDLSGLILIAELQLILIDGERDRSAVRTAGAWLHFIGHAVLGYPADRLRAVPVGKGVDHDLVRHHEGGIESKTEMSDDLIFIGLVLIFLQKVRRS